MTVARSRRQRRLLLAFGLAGAFVAIAGVLVALVLRRAPELRLVLHNGGESSRAARAWQALGLPTRRLPSSSPANASWSFERKLAAWREAFEAGGIG